MKNHNGIITIIADRNVTFVRYSKILNARYLYEDKDCLNIFGYIFVIGLFFIIVSKSFLTEGMFFDGVLYSKIANNISTGKCSFWQMMVTDTDGSAFYSHPPLALWLQSLFYDVFGNGFLVEKIYSMTTLVATIFLLLFVWRELGFLLKKFWFVLLLWLFVPTVTWCSTNNMLENTMGIFTLASILMYLISLKHNQLIRILFCFFSGTMLFLAFLCKGFTGLYPLVFPVLYWLFIRKGKFITACLDEFIVVLGLVIPAVLMLAISHNAYLFFEQYIKVQIVESLSAVQTDGSRFYILLSFFNDMILPFVIAGVVIIVGKVRKTLIWNKNNISISLLFLSLALSGVLPMIISLKQSRFYILTVFPLMAISIGALLLPTLESFSFSEKMRKIIAAVSVAIFVAAISLNVFFFGKIGRDEEMISDIHLLLSEIPEKNIVNVDEDVYYDYQFCLYCARYHDISVERGDNQKYKIVLLDHLQVLPDSSYRIVKGGVRYALLGKREE